MGAASYLSELLATTLGEPTTKGTGRGAGPGATPWGCREPGIGLDEGGTTRSRRGDSMGSS
jgi:hypothetical protein